MVMRGVAAYSSNRCDERKLSCMRTRTMKDTVLAHLNVQAPNLSANSPSKPVAAKRDKAVAGLQTPASTAQPTKAANREIGEMSATSLQDAFDKETAQNPIQQQQQKQQQQQQETAGNDNIKVPVVVGSGSAESSKQQEQRQPAASACNISLPSRMSKLLIACAYSMGVQHSTIAAVAAVRRQFPDLLLNSEPLQETLRELRQVVHEQVPVVQQVVEATESCKDLQEKCKNIEQELAQLKKKEHEWQQTYPKTDKQGQKSYAEVMKISKELEKKVVSMESDLHSRFAAAQQQLREDWDKEEKVQRTFKAFGSVPGVTDKDSAYVQAQAALKLLGLEQSPVEMAKMLYSKKEGSKPVLCFRLASAHHATELRARRRGLKGKGYVLVDELTAEEYQRFAALRPRYKELKAAGQSVWWERARLFTSSTQDGRRKVEELQPPERPLNSPTAPRKGAKGASTSK